ncbi:MULTISPECIES: hypothetical protein [unclassified Rathayibacter]|uniref:hypothetical protein n=1 Tax=unclassified Rathayibacter TaxID=2609250 RepID=UPI001FB3ABBB|nr:MULTISPECIES: hypothetical protein [unclassified Rathayibacter]MCJ1674795.1 hypothetical protein [Rathayibacter sp. VKM Ac-2929]MCJ1683754.1 hypothetical protein [Rathayibacter sp. VKM Ac-2928]MCJ1689374.1 hypothetical protein [Rathayibacter sp. VKM Ac-2927]
MPPRPSAPAGPTRRTIAASAAWSLPVVSAAVAAPLAAASPASCRSTAVFTQTSVASNPTVLTAVAPGGAVSTVRIDSALAAGTTTATQGRDFNLVRDGNRWASGGSLSAVSEVVVRNYPAGSLMLNQRRSGPITEDPSPGPDAQTLTFTFVGPDGRSFDPTDVQLSIQNITSDTNPGYPWLLSWWSTVGFSVRPASISSTAGHEGVGTGTAEDPFRRAASSDAGIIGRALIDTFTFGAFPSGSTLTYSQHQGHQGWHASALGALSFVSYNC